jgi:hypothetical protein
MICGDCFEKNGYSYKGLVENWTPETDRIDDPEMYRTRYNIALNNLIQEEYQVSEDEASRILNSASECSVNSACDLFAFIQEDMNLISRWNRSKWVDGINSRLIDEYEEKQLEEDDTNNLEDM